MIRLRPQGDQLVEQNELLRQQVKGSPLPLLLSRGLDEDTSLSLSLSDWCRWRRC